MTTDRSRHNIGIELRQRAVNIEEQVLQYDMADDTGKRALVAELNALHDLANTLTDENVEAV